MGNRAAVDQVLSRLTKAGKIRRTARGVYDIPKTHPTLGAVSPDPDAIAKSSLQRIFSNRFISSRFGILKYDNVMDSVVVRDPEIMSGEPTFRGTRVLVRTLFDYIEAGYSLDRFLEGFPTVDHEMALLAIEEAKESLLASH